MQPTPEQLAIYEAVQQTIENIMIVALAGTGKTTTLEELGRRVADTPILYLVFNKRNADEAVKRMPSHVEPKTFNALGHRVWGSTTGKKLIVDKDKIHKICKQLISEAPKREQSELWECLGDTMRWITWAKQEGYIPRNALGGKALCDFTQLCANHNDEPPDADFFNSALSRSIDQAWAGNIDFNDQLYMPVVYGGSFPKYPKVMCDEVQDLSPINHVMLERLATGARLIAVGDPWQSIYAFRGAVQGGMADLTAKFHMRELPLSVTFRVPQAGVRRAWFRVPHYKAFDLNPEGTVREFTEWSATDVPDDAAIICRNNAPLFSCALRLLRSRRAVRLVGMEIGPGLIRTMKKLGPLNLNKEQMYAAIESWASGQITAGKSESNVAERAECLYVLCNKQHLEAAIRDAEELFKMQGPIQLMSIHKAKGLEFSTVIHLDPWRIPSKYAIEGTEEYEQELNCRYVAETRFKQTLILANLEDFR